MPLRSSGHSLPSRPDPDWYRKAAKRRLAELRALDADATLSLAQLDIARTAGFTSWRALIAAIDARRAAAPAMTTDGKTPLHDAAETNDAGSIAVLLEQGADPEARYGEGGHTALSWAVTMSAFDAAAALVGGGARTDLFCAAAMGDTDGVRSFFDADRRLKADAADTCRVRFLSLVTPRGERQESRDVVSDAMYAAVRHNRVAVARLLMEHRADVRSRAFLGATLLHWAHYVGSQPIIAMLLEEGADPRARDETFGCTPRAFAICAPARLGAMDLVTARLNEDPSLATINEGRGTPLHEAARAGHEAIVRLLIARGADPFARDQAGRTPRDLADANAGRWVEVLR
jgi:ankyrin repeat protein